MLTPSLLTEQMIGFQVLLLYVVDSGHLFLSSLHCEQSTAPFPPNWWDHWSLGQHYECLAGHEGPEANITSAAVCRCNTPRLQTFGLFLYSPTSCEVISLIWSECKAQIQWYACRISKYTSADTLHCLCTAVACQKRHRLANDQEG